MISPADAPEFKVIAPYSPLLNDARLKSLPSINKAPFLNTWNLPDLIFTVLLSLSCDELKVVCPYVAVKVNPSK